MSRLLIIVLSFISAMSFAAGENNAQTKPQSATSQECPNYDTFTGRIFYTGHDVPPFALSYFYNVYVNGGGLERVYVDAKDPVTKMMGSIIPMGSMVQITVSPTGGAMDQLTSIKKVHIWRKQYWEKDPSNTDPRCNELNEKR